MSTENLLPHEELLVEISRTCRRLGVCTPMKEFINAAHDLFYGAEDSNEIRTTARDVMHRLNPHSEPPEEWKITRAKEEINEEFCARCCDELRRMNAGEILWHDKALRRIYSDEWREGVTDEEKENFYKSHPKEKELEAKFLRLHPIETMSENG